MRIKHLGFVLAVVVAAALAVLAQPQTGRLAVHEWGTFTSFQGSDGTVLPWKPLVTSQLPSFVYDWQKPGLAKQSLLLNPDGTVGKGRIAALQRLETPVIYFYSDQPLTADVFVRFPKGLVTEWFPHASEVAPSIAATGSNTNPMQEIVQDSLIHWSNIRVMPNDTNNAAAHLLPTDQSGSHYFAARNIESATLQINAGVTNQEFEKFLFYRGVGFFETPLRVVMKSDDAVNIANTSNEPMAHLFVLNIKGDRGNYIYVPELAPGEVKTVIISHPDGMLSTDKLSEQLAGQMAKALTTTGLYPKEAAAMVDTWKDSWFQEQGVRVLYVLPRAWTDATLPMTLKPAPQQVVRTMVGRAEVLPPGVEHDLAVRLDKINHGDAVATAEARSILKDLGRFAEPALYQVIDAAKAQPAERDRLLTLLNPAPKFE